MVHSESAAFLWLCRGGFLADGALGWVVWGNGSGTVNVDCQYLGD